MVLTSLNYFTFLALVLLLYYIMPKKLQWIVLLLFSVVFVLSSTTDFVQVMLHITYGVFITFLGAIFIHKLKKGKKIVEIITILLALIQLFFLKYLDNPMLNFVAPIGISFYTLTAVGYVIDVYRGVIEPQKNILKHALYVLYFPQLVSGPITRYSEMEKQLWIGHTFECHHLLFGFQRILWGVFKKIVIAERLAIIVNSVYENYYELNGVYIVIATMAFAFQLYSDFSGCMDIVIGTSEMFGIVLPENFRAPFFSKSDSEFWRRWHITLGTWFKDYLFYPVLKSDLFQNMQKRITLKLGKNWGKRLPLYVAMLILWIVVGAWHGGNVKFIIGSGILHWFYIVFGQIFEPLFNKIAQLLRIHKERKAFQLWQIVRTFLLICIGFVFFRASSVSDAVHMLVFVFKNNYYEIFTGGLEKFGLEYIEINVLMISFGVLFLVDYLSQKGSVREKIVSQHLLVRCFVWTALILGILIFGKYGVGYDASAFIYQMF